MQTFTNCHHQLSKLQFIFDFFSAYALEKTKLQLVFNCNFLALVQFKCCVLLLFFRFVNLMMNIWFGYLMNLYFAAVVQNGRSLNPSFSEDSVADTTFLKKNSDGKFFLSVVVVLESFLHSVIMMNVV